MKKNKFLLICFILLSNVENLGAQNDITINVKDACHNTTCTGSIEIVIDPQIIDQDEWPLPYRVDFLNIEQETMTELEMNSYEDTFNDFCIGKYEIVIHLNEYCTITEEVEIKQTTPITITAAPSPICQEGTGEISPTITGGTEPYAFAWSNGATTQDISGLSTGTYTLTVTDDNGCSAEI